MVRCETLVGEWHWLFEQDRSRSWPDFSAGEFNLADQNTVEPVLLEAARARGADQRFNTQMVSFEPDSDGVSAVIEHRETGQRRTVRADYLIAADGVWFIVNPTIGVTVGSRVVVRRGYPGGFIVFGPVRPG